MEKCADPVIAQLTLESERGIEFEGNITESTTFGFGWVTMERNDTHLSFSVSESVVPVALRLPSMKTSNIDMFIYMKITYMYSCKQIRYLHFKFSCYAEV